MNKKHTVDVIICKKLGCGGILGWRYLGLEVSWVGGILEVSCAGEFKHEALAEAQPEKCSRVYVYCLFFGSRVCIPFQELVIVGRVPAEKYL